MAITGVLNTLNVIASFPIKTRYNEHRKGYLSHAVIASFPIKTRYNPASTYSLERLVIASFPIKTRYNRSGKSGNAL